MGNHLGFNSDGGDTPFPDTVVMFEGGGGRGVGMADFRGK